MNTQNTISHKNPSSDHRSETLSFPSDHRSETLSFQLNLSDKAENSMRRSLRIASSGFGTRCKNLFVPALVLITATTYSCKKDSEKFDSLQRDADIAYVKQDFNGALSLYTQALEMNSDSIRTIIMLGKIHYYKKDFEKAEELFQDAVNKDKCDASAAYWLSKIESLRSDTRSEAKERLESIINHIPNRWEVEYTLGAVLESEGKIQEAISLYNQAKAESAKLSLLYLRLGKIYHKAQRKEMANRYFERAILISEEDPNSIKMIESEIDKEQ